MPSEPPPGNLIAGLHRGEPESQALLKSWCRQPIGRLVDWLRARHHLGSERELLIKRTLHWAAMYLRSREPADFAGMGRDRFIVSLLARAFKLLTLPGLEDGGSWPRLVGLVRTIPRRRGRASRTDGRRRHAGRDHADPITSAPYDIRSHSRSLDPVGGDRSDMAVEGDDSLWAIADVTGHGLPAYLVADGLPHLWGMRSIAALRAQGRPPGDLLDALGEVLEPVLPEAVFVEATLARFTPAGRAEVAGAGFCRLALRRSVEDVIELHRLTGLYLGLGSGRRDHLDWALAAGDQVTMASDSLFEQTDNDPHRSPLEASLARRAAAHLAAGRALHDAISVVLEEALRASPQRADITVLTIRHRQAAPAEREAAHVPM
jgi:hypothetical protein